MRNMLHVPFAVPPRENSSTTARVLEFFRGGTGSITVVDLLFVTVEDGLLFLGREGQFSATAGEILVPSELPDEQGHEGPILFREHLLLEAGEAVGVPDGLRVAVELAVAVFCAVLRIDEVQTGLAFL